MISPVRCTYCGKVYDLADVETIARYADATVFRSPCCKRQVDDREWKSLPDFRRMPDVGEVSVRGFDRFFRRLEDRYGDGRTG